ncbi:hypothetical protein D3C80_2182670 [compost metagenome]
MACIQESEAERQKFLVNDLAHHWDHPNDEVILPKNLSSRIVLCSNIEEQNVCFLSATGMDL